MYPRVLFVFCCVCFFCQPLKFYHFKFLPESLFKNVFNSLYCILQEDHGNQIFGVKFNEFLEDERTFATVGSNRVCKTIDAWVYYLW